jgi:hypothetical protein
MYNAKPVFIILLLSGTLSSWIYAFVLLIKYLKGHLTKGNVIKKTFWVTFCGWLSMFIAYFVWLDNWEVDSLIFFTPIALIFSLFGAFTFTASFLFQKK